ncbi:MAG: ribonuclease III [Oscillospiraceae bacterium]|jgi:ribonuclease-3 family protein|nr:ribonuclease III [Oscillospiraceae bacterium]
MLTTPLSDEAIASLGILAVASVGDSVFDLMVRVRLCGQGAARAEDLHNRRVRYVNAKAQAAAAKALAPALSGEETAVFRRGRNTQTGSVPQSAGRADYQAATALEALFGWLCLKGREERLKELFALTMKAAEENS